MIIQQDILAFLWNMGEVQIDEFEVFEGKEQNKIERVRILQTGANDEYISKYFTIWRIWKIESN